VGQTGKQFKTRITEHRNHTNRNINTYSVIAELRIEYDHDFNWEEFKIIKIKNLFAIKD